MVVELFCLTSVIYQFLCIGRERERREKVKKKIGGAGKTHFVSRKFLPKTK